MISIPSERVLVDLAVLHDDADGLDALITRFGVEVFWISADHCDVLQRVAAATRDTVVRAKPSGAEASKL